MTEPTVPAEPATLERDELGPTVRVRPRSLFVDLPHRPAVESKP